MSIYPVLSLRSARACALAAGLLGSVTLCAQSAMPAAATGTAATGAAASVASGVAAVSAAERTGSQFYSDSIERLSQSMAADPALKEQVDLIIAEAYKIAARPLVRRMWTLDELRRNDKMDPRASAIEKIDPNKAQIFALAEADKSAGHTLAHEIPLLAATYRLTGDPLLLERLIAQLEELVTWDPLQRPGWSVINASVNLPQSGSDGVWLATGLGLVTLSQTLEILSEGSLPPELEAKIAEQIDREIKYSEHDWANKVSWFMKGNVAASNQWVVPSSGLVVAAAMNLEKYRDAYELGVSNLLMSLSAIGEEGASSEGVGYAMHMTAPFLYMAAIASSSVGDDRLASHPFLQNFPEWLTLSFQPGQSVINAFDGYQLARGIYHTMAANISSLAALSANAQLEWLLREQIGSTSSDLYGLMLLNGVNTALPEPPAYGSYERGSWVVWRSDWGSDASGVWLRGGHHADQHDHNDRGHVNFIAGGKPLLIEAGTPGYGHKLKVDRYDSVVGHNVLQVGGEIHPRRRPAPIAVNRLDASGGDVTIDAGAGYANVERWTRNARWDADVLTVTDEVVLRSPDVVVLRWHLGSQQPFTIDTRAEGGGTVATASLPAGEIVYPGWIGGAVGGSLPQGLPDEILQTPAASITVESASPLEVSQEEGIDHTLKFRIQDNSHSVLLVRSAGKVKQIKITTVITADR